MPQNKGETFKGHIQQMQIDEYLADPKIQTISKIACCFAMSIKVCIQTNNLMVGQASRLDQVMRKSINEFSGKNAGVYWDQGLEKAYHILNGGLNVE